MRGEPGSDAQAAGQGYQECLCLGVPGRQPGLSAHYRQSAQRGEDGRGHPGSLRNRGPRVLFPYRLGCGQVDEFLSHGWRDSRGRGGQYRLRTGQGGRGRRQDPALLSQVSGQGSADVHAPFCTQGRAGCHVCPGPEAGGVQDLNRRRCQYPQILDSGDRGFP